MRVLKYRKTVSGESRVISLARKVESIKARRKAKRSNTIKTKYHHHQQQGINLINKTQNTLINKHQAESLIKAQGLDKVSAKPIPQHPTVLDKTNKMIPIIKMDEKIHIPDMEVIMNDIPIVHFPTLTTNKSVNKPTPTSIPSATTSHIIPTTTNLQQPKALQTVEQNPSKDHAIKQYVQITKSMDEDYIIAIPSYNRPDMIQVKTLALLHRYKIPTKKIIIFVANKEQYDLYKEKVPEFLYGGLVIGHLGLKNQRNFIMNYYPEGKHIVQMDDDINKIMELSLQIKVESKKHSSKRQLQKAPGHISRKTSKRASEYIKNITPIQDLDAFIKKAFQICNEKGIFLWGVYPLANARYMSPKVTTDLRFIVGPFWGIINRHRPDLRITIDEKENAERTLQHYTIDHSVLRFNNIGIETRYYKNKGGMQDEGKNRKEEALKSVYYLHQKYPKLTKIYLGKKSGVPEIRLRDYSS
jgi:hypothetical protein